MSNTHSPHTRAHLLLATALLLPACGPSPAPEQPVLLEKGEKLKPKPPATVGAQTYVIQTAGSKIGFEMEAPFEKIRGRIPATSYSGQLSIDTAHIDKTTGLLTVKLSGLELFQRKAGDDGKFGEESKSDTQNAHARNWLEIGEDAPADQRSKNTQAEFSITSIKDVDHNDLSQLAGNKRTVHFTAMGNLRLHQRVAHTELKMEAVFNYSGDAPKSVHVRSLESLAVDLAAHDIRPRTAFGKLAQKTLEAMAPKVAKIAQVQIQLNAKRSSAKK